MVLTCSSYGCTNRRQKGSDIHFHRFPLNRPDVLNEWIKAMKRDNFIPNKYSYLCSDHFTEDNYQIRPGSNIKLLLNSAVPSIFRSFPKRLQNTKVVGRQSFNKHQLDFTDTPTVFKILKNTFNKTNNMTLFKCEQCFEIKPTMAEFAKHLGICRSNNLENSGNSKSVQCNFETPTKFQMRKKIRLLQQCLEQKEIKIKSLKCIIKNMKKNIPSSNEVEVKLEEQSGIFIDMKKNGPSSNEVSMELEEQSDLNKPSTSTGNLNDKVPNIQEPLLQNVTFVNNVEQNEGPINLPPTERITVSPGNDNNQIVLVNDNGIEQEKIIVIDDDEPQLIDDVNETQIIISDDEDKPQSIEDNQNESQLISDDEVDPQLNTDDQNESQIIPSGKDESQLTLDDKIKRIIFSIWENGEFLVLSERQSLLLTPQITPYKIKEMTLQGKLIRCINVKPYSFLEFMVTLENLVQTVLFPCSVKKCINVLRDQLKINLYCGNLEQMKLLFEQNLITSLSPRNFPIVMLNDLIPVLIKLKKLLKK